MITELQPGIIDQINDGPEWATSDSHFDSNVCWLTADGRLIRVRDMGIEHLTRTVTMLLFTKRVESRGVYRENGQKIAVWSRFEWANFLQAEELRRGV